MKKRILIGTVLATTILILMSFNSVAASDVHQQRITEKSILVREHFYKLSSGNPKFDIFTILDILSFLFGAFLYLGAWFLINIWANIVG